MPLTQKAFTQKADSFRKDIEVAENRQREFRASQQANILRMEAAAPELCRIFNGTPWLSPITDAETRLMPSGHYDGGVRLFCAYLLHTNHVTKEQLAELSAALAPLCRDVDIKAEGSFVRIELTFAPARS